MNIRTPTHAHMYALPCRYAHAGTHMYVDTHIPAGTCIRYARARTHMHVRKRNHARRHARSCKRTHAPWRHMLCKNARMHASTPALWPYMFGTCTVETHALHTHRGNSGGLIPRSPGRHLQAGAERRSDIGILHRQQQQQQQPKPPRKQQQPQE